MAKIVATEALPVIRLELNLTELPMLSVFPRAWPTACRLERYGEMFGGETGWEACHPATRQAGKPVLRRRSRWTGQLESREIYRAALDSDGDCGRDIRLRDERGAGRRRLLESRLRAAGLRLRMPGEVLLPGRLLRQADPLRPVRAGLLLSLLLSEADPVRALRAVLLLRQLLPQADAMPLLPAADCSLHLRLLWRMSRRRLHEGGADLRGGQRSEWTIAEFSGIQAAP